MGDTESSLESILAPYPPAEDDPGRRARTRAEIRSRLSGHLCVLDDDPTGTQTVHDLRVYLGWDVETLASAGTEGSVFFVSNNARSLAPEAARCLYRETGRNLAKVFSCSKGGRLRVFLRGDSTLRGHFPLDAEALQEGLRCEADGIILVPAFPETGRLTIGGVHLLCENGRVVPVGETEYARDPLFGYRNSRLDLWAEEKTQGRLSPPVRCIGLRELRKDGPEGAASILVQAKHGAIFAADAASYSDLEVLALGLAMAEEEGKRFIPRCSASFVKACAGLEDRPFLSASEMRGVDPGPGVVIVGSWVARTGRQLDALLSLPRVRHVELSCGILLGEQGSERLVRAAARQADAAIRACETIVVSASRGRLPLEGEAFLAAGERIMDGLCSVTRGMRERPSFMIAKGGITSDRIARSGLGVHSALVLGQAETGIPVWRLGPESRFPGLPYIVFPGNVGDDGALARICASLDRDGEGEST